MSHTPFLNALASTKTSDDPLWQVAAAGYLTLRFFDIWLAVPPQTLAQHCPISEIRTGIIDNTEMESKLQHLLLAIVDAIEEAPEPNPHFVAESWLAYARYLENAGYPELAHHILTVAYQRSAPRPRSTLAPLPTRRRSLPVS